MRSTPARAAGFGYCTLHSATDTSPSFHEGDLDTLYEHLTKHTRVLMLTREEFGKLSKIEQRHVKSGPAFVLAVFSRPGVREDAAVVHTTALGLDVDEAHIEPDVLRALLAGVDCIIYETAQSRPEARRYRIIIAYTRPATEAEHRAAHAYWRTRIPGVASSSANPSRPWYANQRFKDDPPRLIERHAGDAFDPATTHKPSTRDAFKRNITLPVGQAAPDGDRNNELNRYATSVVRDCSSEMDLYSVLLEKNETYEPPLDAKEVRQLAKRKWAKRAMFGWLDVALDPNPPDLIASSQDEPDDVGVDAASLFDTDHGPVPWVIDNILTYGAHLLVGRSKGGKSWLTMDMSLCVGAGAPFLGHPCQQGSVLWISGEDTRASLGRRLKVRGERPQNVRIMTMEDIVTERDRPEAEGKTFYEWLEFYLTGNPSVRLVIIDTHKTVEAKWNNEDIDKKRHASITDIAYQEVRFYETIGKTLLRAIVLVHHQGKMKHNKGTDYHERVNLPATVVAGVAASLVLSDHPDRDIHDEDDRRRVFSTRGRDIIKDQNLMIEFDAGRVKLLGAYADIAKNEAFAEVMEAVEALLGESDTTTIEAVAKHLSKHRTSVQRVLGIAAKRPGGIVWKGRTLKSKQRVGLFWDRA